MLSGATPSACAIAGTAVFRMVVSSDSMKNATATSHGSSRFVAAPVAGSRSGTGDGCIHDHLRFAEDPPQVIAAAETLAIDLVYVLGARGAGCEPAARADDLDAAERCADRWRLVQNGRDGIARQLADPDFLGRELRQFAFLRRRGRCLDAVGVHLAERRHEVAVA